MRFGCVVVGCVVVATIATANDSSASFLSVILIVFVRSLSPVPLFTYPVIISIVLRPLVLLFPNPHRQPIAFTPFQFQFTWMELLICNRWSNSTNTFNNNNNKRIYVYTINKWSHFGFEPMHAQMIDSFSPLWLPLSFRSLQYEFVGCSQFVKTVEKSFGWAYNLLYSSCSHLNFLTSIPLSSECEQVQC